MAILIAGERIEAVLPAAEARELEVGARIDGGGRAVIPGLWDMHVHFQELTDEQMALFPAFGVTSVRDMGDHPRVLAYRREGIAAGQLVGPRIRSSIYMLDNEFLMRLIRRGTSTDTVEFELARRLPVNDVEEAWQAVERVKEEGGDFVKVHQVDSREAYLALGEASADAGLRLAGHAPAGLAPADWLTVRQQTIDHLLGGWGRGILQLEADERATFFTAARDVGLCFVPTLVLHGIAEHIEPQHDLETKLDRALDHPQADYVSADLVEFWRAFFLTAPAGLPGLEVFDVELQLLREAHAAGVPILPGTDLGIPRVFAGYSLHDELALLVEHVGLTPLEAIGSATRIPPMLFGLADDLGTLEPGKIADLVVLDGNPLEDIGNTRRIHGVMQSGRYHDRTAIDAWLEAARE